jgi:ATP-dependent Lhr-like helicase
VEVRPPPPLRARLRRTWYALFAHHRGLLPIQEAAIPHLLDGRECLLCAPTAGGKTEALVAAALEHATGDEGAHGPEVVYICPTRALVNDVHRRLTPIAHRLHLRVGRHTADHRPDPDRLPHLLVTTPEGLDARLCRHPGTLRSARWLLLDELHLLAGALRGDQLAALVSRLRVLTAAAGGDLCVAGASATLPEPEAVAARYLRDPVVVTVPGSGRRLNLTARPAETLDQVVAALSAARGKTLVFANSRNRTETVAAALRGRPPFGDAVYAHHGSLLKAERERVEAAFLSRSTALCVATQTLELGIDIGDVDRVALYGPPPDVSALLQRIGRAGRRTGHAEVLLLAADPAEALRFAFLLDRAEAEDLCGDLLAYHPASVVQQAASLLMQNRTHTLTVGALLERLPPWQATYWSAERLTAALAERVDLFRRHEGTFVPADGLEQAFVRGTMHSQLGGDGAGVIVFDALTQRPIGRVEAVEKGESLTLGGHAARVVGRRGNDVWVEGADAAELARFRPRPGPVMGPTDARRYLSFLGVVAPDAALLPGLWVHGLGEAHGRVVAAALRALRFPVAPAGPLAFTVDALPGDAHRPPPDLPLDLLLSALDRHQASLARLTGQGPDFRHLPAEERARAIRLAVPPELVRARWRALRWIAPAPETRARLLAVIAPTGKDENDGT